MIISLLALILYTIHKYITPVDSIKPKYLLKPLKPFFRNCRPLSGLVLSTNFRYKVVYLGLVKSKDWTRGGIYVDINNIVEKKITGWQVDAKTLTTRVGGVIGVGKNLFWVAILLITSSVSFLGLVSKYFKKKFIK